MIYYENNWTRYDQFSNRRYKTSCFLNFHPRDLNITEFRFNTNDKSLQRDLINCCESAFDFGIVF
jgi:hypothetical protein